MPLSDKPVISVIMPAYNHEKYVEEAIMSVLNQEGVDFELIVINDGSTDKTAEIIELLVKQHGFNYVARANKGLLPTIKDGLKIAKGEFVTILASDDFYIEERLSAAVDLFKGLPPKIVTIFGKAIVVDCDSKVIGNYERFSTPAVTKFYYNELMVSNWICAVTTTHRLSFLRSMQFTEGSKIEDWPILLSAAKKGGVFDSGLRHSFYRMHGFNSMINWSAETKLIQMALVSKGHPPLIAYNNFKLSVRKRELVKSCICLRIVYFIVFLRLLRELRGKL
jgi:alpha-1,3-rhamnosyltransferase